MDGSFPEGEGKLQRNTTCMVISAAESAVGMAALLE